MKAKEVTTIECYDVIIKRISLLPNCKMNKKMFEKKSNEFALYLIENIGFDTLNKMKYIAPLSGEFWQFQYSK
jgi:hypothetical protein